MTIIFTGGDNLGHNILDGEKGASKRAILGIFLHSFSMYWKSTK